MPNTGFQGGHRARQHSQGFFEPSLPHTTSANNGLTASQIAAQAAMQHLQGPQGERKRSQPGLTPIITGGPAAGRRKPSGPSPIQSPPLQSAGGLTYQNGTLGGNRLAATTAANAAFPRSPLPSPNPRQQAFMPPPMPPQVAMEKEPKAKSSKMKLFSKPKNIGLGKDKDVKPAMPSPGKGPLASSMLRNGFANASTTSLIDPLNSSASSLYSSANASTSTLVPTATEKEKDKHRHNFLSRQKHKLKEQDALPLSSASSNSQATNPAAPQPLYSFTPSSPAVGSSAFAKSMSGLDLRHGGRALREKKKEEKAAAAASANLTPIVSNSSMNLTSSSPFPPEYRNEFVGPSSLDQNVHGPPSGASASVFSFQTDTTPAMTATAFSNIGASMGLTGIGPDDAWPLLKARLLNIFEGEDLRTPIEDFNLLVNVHIRRCIQKRAPIVLVEDLRELLQTGFSSLSQTLRGVPDDRLVPKLVEMWLGVFGSIIPFIQAVFLPLDLEFKGRGQIMSVREASEFWGAMPESLKSDERPSSAGGMMRLPTLGEELDVRRITLITFRDVVILPKHESLMAIFSRLSLDSINASSSPDTARQPGRERGGTDPAAPGAERPGTANSLSPHLSSFNSQSSTLLDTASTSSGGGLSQAARSRATSNTSAGSFGTSLPHLNSPFPAPGSFSSTPLTPAPAQLADPAKVTETVARMLQCVSVLASCQTGDVGQGVVDRLTGALKYNWLGRGRTGRQRRGWVGMRNPPAQRAGLVGA